MDLSCDPYVPLWIMWYAHKSVTSREASDAASTRPILAIEGLSSARAKVPTDREIEINLKSFITSITSSQNSKMIKLM